MLALTSDIASGTAKMTWKVLRKINSLLPEGDLPSPSWAPGRLLKQRERTPMALGVPRRTQSLCPDCNREAVERVLKGEMDLADFRDNPGCADDCGVHGHGPNRITSGRGTFLVVDLTNRCNMMCSPCFMDANAASYVHEFTMEDIKVIFSNARSFKPQREINILFSGGEPTISPIFLDAIRHAKSVGFDRLHAATNGIRFAESRDLALQAREAGLHGVYLQIDGVSEEKNKHRGLRNYMPVRRQALENIAAAGMRTTLQVTVLNGVNNDGLGDIARFAIQNIDKIHGVVFQPIMFAGRDEYVSPDERYARRYPLTQLAFDLHEQTSMDWQPMRDWFPLSDVGIFAHLCDVLNPNAKLGSPFQEAHPNRGIFSACLRIVSIASPAAAIPAGHKKRLSLRDAGGS